MNLKVGLLMGSQPFQGAFRVRGGKGWAHYQPVPGRTSVVGILAHVQVLAGYDPWLFLKIMQIALETGRTHPRTIWIDR